MSARLYVGLRLFTDNSGDSVFHWRSTTYRPQDNGIAQFSGSSWELILAVVLRFGYNLLLTFVKPVVQPGLTTGWTNSGCSFMSNRLSNRFDNRLDNRLYRVNGVTDVLSSSKCNFTEQVHQWSNNCMNKLLFPFMQLFHSDWHV